VNDDVLDVERLADAIENYLRSAKSDPSPWARNPEDIAADLAAEYDRAATRPTERDCTEHPGWPPHQHTRPAEPFKPDYDWTSTCPHEGDDVCPDGDDGCRCECHAVPMDPVENADREGLPRP
jgi:hypothetical protein